jgi:hypothetical protein
VRQPPLQRKDHHPDDDRRDESDRHALQDGERALLDRERLDEQRRLEALAIDAREAEEHEADDLRGRERHAGAGQDRLLLAVQALQVLLPVDPVVEPVEDQQQDPDRDQRGSCARRST